MARILLVIPSTTFHEEPGISRIFRIYTQGLGGFKAMHNPEYSRHDITVTNAV
jgi:hypothetical protein